MKQDPKLAKLLPSKKKKLAKLFLKDEKESQHIYNKLSHM